MIVVNTTDPYFVVSRKRTDNNFALNVINVVQNDKACIAGDRSVSHG